MQAFAEDSALIGSYEVSTWRNDGISNEKRMNLSPSFEKLSLRHWPVINAISDLCVSGPKRRSYSRSRNEIMDTKRGGWEATEIECTSGAFHRSKHLLVLLFERATRCYELTAFTLDAFSQCFEQRVALGS